MMDSKDLKDAYVELIGLCRERMVHTHVAGLVGWDTETKMPKKAIQQRGGMMAYLAKLGHQLGTNPRIGQLLEILEKHEDSGQLDANERRNVYLMRRAYDRATKLPQEFVIERSQHGTMAIDAWKKARAKNDWESFKPFLAKSLELAKKAANYLDPNKHAYDVMLDLFEPEMTKEQYKVLFKTLRDGTVELLGKIRDADAPDMSLIRRKVPVATQRELMDKLARMIGFDMERGRLDESAHPFTGGPGYDDIRITTRYDEDDIMSSFFSVAHEGGHGMYEQNMAPDRHYEPIGHHVSMGIHESQSRFFENMICRSSAFWEFYFPAFVKMTGEIFADAPLEDFVKAVNAVEPSKIRVEADEVTYNLHIILRFELELDLFEGRVSVDDLPAEWNKRMKEYLDVDIESDAEGVMQDIHWSSGGFGYFPTYTLGNMYAAQFLHYLEKDIPDWEDKLRKGDLLALRDWMVEKIHNVGNLFDPADLVKHVTGEVPNAEYLLAYLNKKYGKLYGF